MKEGNQKITLVLIYFYSYWFMNFFAGPQMLDSIKTPLKLHPDIIRFTVIKKADTLKHLIRP